MTQNIDDPYRWLEEVDSEEALAWVSERNSRFVDKATTDPGYAPLAARLRSIFDDDDKIAYPSFRGGMLYNFWQDQDHVRGLLRRTTLADYLTGDPDWQIWFDVDAYAEEQGINWVYSGATNLHPDQDRTLLSFSRGGADAVEIREFDRSTGTFVEDGFMLPEAKQSVAWVDEDHLVVGTDFGDGSMTASGYPRILKLWKRGTGLEEATTILEGEPTDVSLRVWTHQVSPGRFETFLTRGTSFYTAEYYRLVGTEVERIDLPDDAYFAHFNNQLLVSPQSDGTFSDHDYVGGSLLAIDYDAFLGGDRRFMTLFAPTEKTSLRGYRTTKDYLLIETLDNVRGRIDRFSFDGEEWQKTRLTTPDIAVARVHSEDDYSNRVFLTVTDFLSPSTLYYIDFDESDEMKPVRQQKSYFDASGLVAEQREATSADGTAIPYFIIRTKDRPLDAKAPTILYGYGGFRVSQLPGYQSATGAAWLEDGGVWVVANIRGGGEFGPAWHAAGLKENRQRCYDDFIAVAEDLIEQKVTSPEHLGIYGGSNGGLLVGAVFVQRPDLFNAVVCAVPLLDMRNYHTMLAGASWMAEYGDPDKPEEWSYISRYSPYHNLKPDADYPEVLFTTSTRDDRVHPAHARKMAARMEEMGHPFYYFEKIEGGHGGATNNEQVAERLALIYTYFRWKLAGS